MYEISIIEWILSRNTDGRSGNDKSFKPVDTVNDSSLEQESVIASGQTTCHTGKSSALAEWQTSYS